VHTIHRICRTASAAVAVLLLLISLASAFAASSAGAAATAAEFDGQAVLPDIVRLDITHTIRIGPLDGAQFTLRESALAFPVGTAGEPVRLLAADASVLDGSAALYSAAEDIGALLEKEGLFLESDEFLGEIEIVGTAVTVSDGDAALTATPVYMPENGGAALLELDAALSGAAPLPFGPPSDLKNGELAYKDAAWLFRLDSAAVILTRDGATAQDGASPQISVLETDTLDSQPDRAFLGSPLLDGTGQVAGIVVWDSGRQSVSSGTPDALLAALDARGVAYVRAEVVQKTQPQSLWMIGAGALALVVFMAVLLVIMARRNIRALAKSEQEAAKIAAPPKKSAVPVPAAAHASSTTSASVNAAVRLEAPGAQTQPRSHPSVPPVRKAPPVPEAPAAPVPAPPESAPVPAAPPRP